MNKILRFLGPIFASVVRSLIVSFIMFILFWSALTQKFPPRWSDLSQITNLTKQMIEIPQRLNQVMGKNLDGLPSDEIEKLNKKRAQISKELLHHLGQKSESSIKDFNEIESQLRQINDRLEKIESDIDYIKRK